MKSKSAGDQPFSWTAADGKTLFVRQLKIAELESVYVLSREQLKAEMASIERAKVVLEYNSDAIWGVYQEDAVHADGKLTGYLSFLMLNEDGATVLKRGELDALHPSVAHMVPSGQTPALIYIWSIVARGQGAVAVPLITHAMGPRYAGVSLCGTAASEAGARAVRGFGFRPVHPNRPDVGNLFWLDRANVPAPRTSHPNTIEARYKVVFATSSREVEQAFAIRAAVFMAEQHCPFDEEFDGNDHAATHVVGYMDGEPAATLRIRYFGNFVKIERLAVLQRFRGSLVAKEVVEATLLFCRRKGYRKGYGHAHRRLVPFWGRFGFRPVEGAPPFVFSDHECIEVEGDLPEYPHAIAIGTDPYVILRPEGRWDQPGVLDRSALRPATNPH